MSHVIVGLGNKGEKYATTRHNAGRSAVSAWVASEGGSFVASSKYQGLVWKGEVAGNEVLALLPETFMNESGGSVKKAVTSKKAAERLVVLHDDIDLPLGTVRVSYDRGSGGHNGIRSVAKALGTGAFVRIRIGVSPVARGVAKKPKGEAAVLAWVMGEFKKAEISTFEAVCKRTGEIIETIIAEGHTVAMNRFNGV